MDHQDYSESNHSEEPRSIDIPFSNNSNEQPYQQDFYSDVLSFTSDIQALDVHQQFSPDCTVGSYQADDDPLKDQAFMNFLMSSSSSDYTTTSQPSLQNAPEKKPHKPKRGSSSSYSTRVGQCEHPKHVLYRQEKYLQSSDANEAASKTIPRRGRPPKGSKSTEFVFSSSPVMMEDPAECHYSIVELTVRPLPKRLEAVVGKSNIKVCLTCLKRSDMDPLYLQDEAYVGPQSIARKKKSSTNR